MLLSNCFLFLFLLPVDIQNRLNRLLGNQIFLHLFLHLTILCIGLFLLNQEPVKLLIHRILKSEQVEEANNFSFR